MYWQTYEPFINVLTDRQVRCALADVLADGVMMDWNVMNLYTDVGITHSVKYCTAIFYKHGKEVVSMSKTIRCSRRKSDRGV